MNLQTLYSHSLVGGMRMINLVNFISALKTSWIRRYVIDKLDDHWADLVDNHLGIEMEKQDRILDYGPEKFNSIIKTRTRLSYYSVTTVPG